MKLHQWMAKVEVVGCVEQFCHQILDATVVMLIIRRQKALKCGEREIEQINHRSCVSRSRARAADRAHVCRMMMSPCRWIPMGVVIARIQPPCTSRAGG